MKIAIVHDWFEVFGGAEKTVIAIAEMFPKADLYTMIFNDDKFAQYFAPSKVHTSYLQKLPSFLKTKHRLLLPIIPQAIESYDLSEYDIVISSSSAFSKNIITSDKTLHICYCHSPMRFAWDYWPQYVDELGYGPIRKFIASKLIHNLRQWDSNGSSRVDVWLTNSKTSQKRIAKYYRKKSEIIYPPADLEGSFVSKKKGNYYITLATLTPYKKIEAAIEAFNISGKKLFVIGDGPDRKRLEKMAAKNIRFAGFVKEKKKWELIAASKGLIFPQEEDFGIAPIDAMACGTPVIAYKKGGVLETVLPGKTGVFFGSQTAEAINKAIAKSETIDWQASAMRKHALGFSKKIFQKNLKQSIKMALKNDKKN